MRMLMDIARQHFFTRAGLARDQHRGITARYSRRQFQQLCAGRLDGHRPFGFCDAKTTQRMARHQIKQSLGFKRLDQIIRCALAHGIHRPLHRPVRGHEQHRQLRLPRPQQTQQLVPVHARHVHVADHQAKGFGRHRLQRFFSRANCMKTMPRQ